MDTFFFFFHKNVTGSKKKNSESVKSCCRNQQTNLTVPVVVFGDLKILIQLPTTCHLELFDLKNVLLKQSGSWHIGFREKNKCEVKLVNKLTEKLKYSSSSNGSM